VPILDSGVSVIIPVFDSWEVLHRSVAAVVYDCRAAGLPWELIMVDNDSGGEFIAQACRFVEANPEAALIRRTGLGGRNFQPGAARNLGIDHAKYGTLIFLDADCIPARHTIERYRAAVAEDRRTVFVGHREFVDAANLPAAEAAADRDVLERRERVGSASNYGERVERRMPELLALEQHDRPYDCMYACNMACHVSCLGDLRFDPVFDGRWGYEDIELGYRLHRAGRRFAYVPEAYVFHQESPWQANPERGSGRRENFLIAGERIPGFIDYRNAHSRAGASPLRDADDLSSSGRLCTSDSSLRNGAGIAGRAASPPTVKSSPAVWPISGIV
jgi:glycosyltransferase involved in cell wall biosynthesis